MPSEGHLPGDLSLLGPLLLALARRLQERALWRLFVELEAPLAASLAVLQDTPLAVDAALMARAGNALQVGAGLWCCAVPWCCGIFGVA